MDAAGVPPRESPSASIRRVNPEFADALCMLVIGTGHMDRKEVVRVALRTLARNKLRTALTLLGITIGISAVICTVAIGQGGQAAIQEQMLVLGDNFVWIEPGRRHAHGGRTRPGNTHKLGRADLHAMLH